MKQEDINDANKKMKRVYEVYERSDRLGPNVLNKSTGINKNNSITPKSPWVKGWLIISENPLVSTLFTSFIIFIVGSYINWKYPLFPCWDC